MAREIRHSLGLLNEKATTAARIILRQGARVVRDTGQRQ